MKTRFALTLVTLFAIGLAACGDTGGNTGSPAKDVAIGWLEAAANGDDAKLQSLTDVAYQDSAVSLAKILREDGDYELSPGDLAEVRWTPSEIVGEIHEWTAHTVTMVSFKLKEIGGEWKVIEVDTI